jgi:hypothetical protein
MTTTSILVGLGGSGYKVSNSLRFRSSASAYLSRTESAAATSNQKLTFSAWVKRGSLTGNLGSIYQAGLDASCDIIRFTNTDTLQVWFNAANSVALGTSAVFRDPSAWYHIVVAIDTTQATSTNRIIIYVNGVIQTLTGTQPSLNATFAQFNQNTIINRFGYYNSTYFDGYIAEAYMIDGQALAASSFGTYDTNGVWQPIKYSGSFGTNGFYLNFGNTTSTTTLGYDTSGNSNNWTTNNVSLTAGSTYDSMTDSPTVSSATVANYATWNAINNSTTNSYTFSNGNLGATVSAASGGRGITSTSGMTSTSGVKYYAEFTVSAWGGSNNSDVGILNTNTSVMTTSSFAAAGCIGTYLSNGYAISQAGTVANNGTNLATGLTTFANGDIIQIAYDGTYIYFGKNGTWLNSAVPASGTGGYSVAAGRYAFAFGVTSNTAQTGTVIGNFGQQPFTYTPPTGFVALNTYNLPTPTIANGAQYMAATTYTGNGSTLSINNGTNTTIGTTFQPDFAWLKSRSAATSNSLSDVLRGIGANSSYPRLISDSTAAESTNGGITSFASTGLTLNADAAITNTNAATYIAWQWKANGTGVSNTNGSITSTVSANTTAGFSVVTYTGTGANATVGHGLGVVPNMIIVKQRNAATADWGVYHSSIGNTGLLKLDTTDAFITLATMWNNTTPTSSVFALGTNITGNGSTTTYVAYCWAAVPGYSAFGSYTGNGSTDGPFVYTGFRPRYVLVKETVTVSNWNQWDSSRNPANLTNLLLRPNSSGAESVSGSTDIQVDFLANGFKIRGSSGDFNTNGELIIYAAFAENPFNSSRAR